MIRVEEHDADYQTCEQWEAISNPFMADILHFSLQGKNPVPDHGLRVSIATDEYLEERDDGRMCWMVSCDAGSLQMDTSIRTARRLARFILDHTEDKKQVPDVVSGPDLSPGEGKPGKREDGDKEEQTKAVEEAA